MPQGFGTPASPARGLQRSRDRRAPFFNEVYSSGRALSFAGFIFWNMAARSVRAATK